MVYPGDYSTNSINIPSNSVEIIVPPGNFGEYRFLSLVATSGDILIGYNDLSATNYSFNLKQDEILLDKPIGNQAIYALSTNGAVLNVSIANAIKPEDMSNIVTETFTLSLPPLSFIENGVTNLSYDINLDTEILSYFSGVYLNPRVISSRISLEILQATHKLPFLLIPTFPDYDQDLTNDAQQVHAEYEFERDYNENTGHAVLLKGSYGGVLKFQKRLYFTGIETPEDLITPTLTVNSVFLGDHRRALGLSIQLPSNRTIGTNDYLNVIGAASIQAKLLIDGYV